MMKAMSRLTTKEMQAARARVPRRLHKSDRFATQFAFPAAISKLAAESWSTSSTGVLAFCVIISDLQSRNCSRNCDGSCNLCGAQQVAPDEGRPHNLLRHDYD